MGEYIARLAEKRSDEAGSLRLDPGHSVENGDLLRVENTAELIRVTYAGPRSLTVSRGAGGTVPCPIPEGAHLEKPL